APAEHGVSCALHPAQDSVEVHRGGFQPRYFHSRSEHGSVRNRGTARLPPQHFRKGQHLRATCCGFLCLAAGDLSHALDRHRPHPVPQGGIYLHNYLGPALRSAGGSATARAAACLASSLQIVTSVPHWWLAANIAPKKSPLFQVGGSFCWATE